MENVSNSLPRLEFFQIYKRGLKASEGGWTDVDLMQV